MVKKKKPTKKPAKKRAPKPKAKPKAKPTLAAWSSLDQFREAAQEYLRADENVRLFTKRRDAQKPAVRSYVEANASALDKGKSRGLVDNAIKWTLVPGAMQVDDAAGVAALQAEIATADGDRKRVLEACLKPTIDKAAWESAKAVGFIDADLIATYERGRSYALKWAHTDQISCHACRAVATRSAKFCGQCGADLTAVPEYLK